MGRIRTLISENKFLIFALIRLDVRAANIFNAPTKNIRLSLSFGSFPSEFDFFVLCSRRQSQHQLLE